MCRYWGRGEIQTATSLSLLQGYSSEEEIDDRDSLVSSSDADDHVGRKEKAARIRVAPTAIDDQSGKSRLPSALDAFSMVTGPPEFLNNCVSEQAGAPERRGKNQGSRRKSKDVPPGVVMEAKAQLVGFHERVRNDVESSTVQPGTKAPVKEAKQKYGATMPGSDDAAELLRMCAQCGVPKTYTNARGMVCPICNDRPPLDPEQEAVKKKGSTIKDKEKSKRMKGQSSHASWKSETEMQLRQQFD